MSGLATMGGVGAGLMAGSQFVQSKRAQDARLGVLQERHDWDREDRQSAQVEAQRKAAFDKIYQDTWNELGVEADPLQVSTEVFRRSVASGQVRREELEPLLTGVRGLRQRGITNAIRMGDGAALASAFSQQLGRPVQIQTQMSKDAFGHAMPVFSVVGEDGTVLQQMDALQIGSILGADGILDDEDRKLSRAKGLADIDQTRASAASSRASAANSYASATDRSESTQWDRRIREAQAAMAAGTATEAQKNLLAQGTRSSATAGGARPPAEVQMAEWLVSQGVADTAEKAWDMVRTARFNPGAVAAQMFRSMREDFNNSDVPDQVLLQRAQEYAQQLQSSSVTAAGAIGRGEDDEDPLGLFK